MGLPKVREAGQFSWRKREAPTTLGEMVDRSRLGLPLTTREGEILGFEPYMPFWVRGCRRKASDSRGVGV